MLSPSSLSTEMIAFSLLVHRLPSQTLDTGIPWDFMSSLGSLFSFLLHCPEWSHTFLWLPSFCMRLQPPDKANEAFMLCLFVWLSVSSLSDQLTTPKWQDFYMTYSFHKSGCSFSLCVCIPAAWNPIGLTCILVKNQWGPLLLMSFSSFALSLPCVYVSFSPSAECNLYLSY